MIGRTGFGGVSYSRFMGVGLCHREDYSSEKGLWRLANESNVESIECQSKIVPLALLKLDKSHGIIPRQLLKRQTGHKCPGDLNEL